LSEIDKLSWLVLGRASDGLGRTDTALLQRAALALLAGEGSGIGDQFTKAIGLDDLSLRQTEGEVRETVISLGKQLSRRWYVGYERSLNATAGTWQLIYRVAQRFTLRAQTGRTARSTSSGPGAGSEVDSRIRHSRELVGTGRSRARPCQ